MRILEITLDNKNYFIFILNVVWREVKKLNDYCLKLI